MIDKPLVEVSPGIRTWNVVLSSMAVLLITLDTTIANIALPRIQNDLNLTNSQLGWILTSYILFNAIFMPLTGFLADRFGKREVLIASVIGFVFTSFLCGISQNLEQLVIARALQGASGAFLMPVTQSILLDIHTKATYAKAIGIWSMGIIIGPILGPTIGGYLTEMLSWHWVFLINFPIGIVLVIGLLIVSPHCPKNPDRRIDLKGFLYLGLAIGLLQLMIDRGEGEDWFDSWEIRLEAIFSVMFFCIFLIHTVERKHPFIQLGCFKDANFLAGLVFASVTSIVIYGTSAILPGYLQGVMRYPVIDAGLLMMPRGLGMFFALMILSRLPVAQNPRPYIAFGFMLQALSLWLMTNFNVHIDSSYIAWSTVLQGIGTSFVFMPTNVLMYLTLEPKYQTDAASSGGLIRNLVGGFAISGVFAVFTRDNQFFHAHLVEAITPMTFVAGWPALLPLDSVQGAWVLNMEITRQAAMQSYLNIFTAMQWMSIVIAALLILTRPKRSKAQALAA